MSISELSRYTSELLNELADDRKRDQARRRLRVGFKFSDEQVSILIPAQKSGRGKVVNLITQEKALPNSEETIKELAKKIQKCAFRESVHLQRAKYISWD